MRAVCWPTLVASLSCLIGCLGDPVGPGGTLVVRRLSPVDSVLVGAPGRPLPTAITFQAVDGDGKPVPAAAVVWTLVGTNGRLEEASGATDSRGQATALWVLGTKASEGQQLTAQVAVGKHHAAITVPAIAKPVEISSIAFGADTTTVKLGLGAPTVVQATDPFGNHFVPAVLRFVSLDTTLLTIDSVGDVQGRGRGWGRIVVASGSARDTAWVHATQVVQAIVASPDTLSFHSLGQTAALNVQLVDDQGGYVRDSLPVDSVPVGTVVSVQPGRPYAVRSVSNGVTPLILRAGAVAHAVQVLVNQRIASVKLSASRVNFDAFGDTVQLTALVADSVGASLANQVLAFSSSDTSVAKLEPSGLVTSKTNGSTWVYARASNGVSDSVRMVVAQQVARVVAQRDSILLDALQAVLPIQATPLDRLGTPVLGAALAYSTGAPSVATVDASGSIRAIANGTTVVTASSGGDTTFVAVRVAQRPVRVVPSSDTVRFVAFGDTRSVTAVAADSLGFPLPGQVTGVLVHDTAVVELLDSVTVRAHGNGVTRASFAVSGLAGQITVIVDQVPTTLTAAVAFGNPVVTLPVGAAFPLACQALDKNGFQIARDPALVGSVHGTVIGSRCGDARVQRSGYDTLHFALGSVQARIPVIVATVPDSVGVAAAAQPLSTVDRTRFAGEDLNNPLILALRPLVADILAAYGNPATNLGRARAIRDWVARTAVHPHAPFHPNGSTSNLGVLPPGKTWADVNALPISKFFDVDNPYWTGVGYDGYAMLDRLLGTLDPSTGLRADDGMMVHVEGVRYQIRDIESYHYTLCTFQAIMLNALWAAAELHGLLISTIGHDPAAVFIPELGRWVYEDPTFNEEYLVDGIGDPVSPIDLLTLSSAGEANRLRATKLLGPNFDPQTYIQGDSYLNEHPEGMVIMGSQLNSRVVGIGGWSTRLVQIDVPRLATAPAPFNNPLSYVPVTAGDAFPTLGVVVQTLQVEDSVYVLQLSSTFPNHERFERRLNGGAWENVAALDVVPVGQCRAEYRSVDAVGSISANTVLEVWVPRGGAFVESGVAGSVRSQARYCVSSSGLGF